MTPVTITVDDARRAIRRSTDSFLASIAEVPDSLWVLQPPNGGWSVAEVTEHVAIANRNLLATLERRLTSPLQLPRSVGDDEIPYLFYRGDEPPDVAMPTGTWIDRHQAADQLDASALGVVRWAAERDDDLRRVGATHPAFGVLDGVQWLLFVSAHTRRHEAQVFGVRSRLMTV